MSAARVFPIVLVVLLAVVAVGSAAPSPVSAHERGHDASGWAAQAPGPGRVPVADAPAEAGAITTAAQAAAGARRRSLQVDGEVDAVRVPHAADLVPDAEFTLELWVKRRPAIGCATLVGKDRRAGMWLAVCDGRLRFSLDGGAVIDGNQVLPEWRWVHVAVAASRTTVTLFVGGAIDRAMPSGGSTPGRTTAPLVIGADAAPGAPFSGWLDEVRLWRVERTAQAIRDDRFRRPGMQPDLIAEWPLDGSARDLVGGHDGEIVSGGAYSFDGVLPRASTLPLTEVPVTVDGVCGAAEYGAADRVVLDGPLGREAFVQASAAYVHVCVAGLARPANQNAYVAAFLDRDGSRRDPAQPGDLRLAVNYRGLARVDEGDGAGGYREVTLGHDAWSAVRAIDREEWAAEMRIARTTLPVPAEPGGPVTFGLALSYADVARQGDDYLWPVAAEPAAPTTWAPVALGREVGLPPLVRLSGAVRRGVGEDGSEGVEGSEIVLFALVGDALTVVDRTITDGGGGYAVAHRGATPDAFVVRQIDPPGMTSVRADAGPHGRAVGANVLRYDAGEGDAFPEHIGDGLFVDRQGPPRTEPLAQHYLIVHAPPVKRGDLWSIVGAKERQGFHVTAASTDEIWRLADGRDLAERVHNWLRAYWEAVEPEPVYALLVGRGDAVPVRDVGWLGSDHRTPGSPTYYPAWPTTWYYADVDSDWDADGDGYYGEFMTCAPGTTYHDPVMGDRECPEAGSLSREGPYGALRSTEDDFVAEIMVGRVAASAPGAVRRALAASVAAESWSSAAKQRVLLAGSFWWFHGSSWSAEVGRSVPGGDPRAHPWLGRAWAPLKPFGLDAAEHLDVSLRAMLLPFTDEIMRLYESTSPGGDPALSPTARQPDAPLTRATLASVWTEGRPALVNLEGLGWPGGVVGIRWQHDWNDDGRIDQPAPPDYCRDEAITPTSQIGPPCWELLDEPIVDADTPAPWAGPPPVVFANSGRTGAVAWAFDGMDEGGNVSDLRFGPAAVAGQLAGRGRVAAWIGAVGPVPPGMLNDAQDGFNADVMGRSLRLGDAFWAANSDLARAAPYDPRAFGLGLFGDPALLHWGGALDTAAVWPQSGRDWRASGSTAYGGPTVPEQRWQLREGGASPVVVDGDGHVFVVLGTDRLVHLTPAGAVVAEVRLPAPLGGVHAHGPALTDNGLVLATDNPPALLRYDRALRLEQQVPLRYGAPAGPVRVGPDGTAWVPMTDAMVRVTAGGLALAASLESPTGGVAWTPDGGVVWSVRDAAVLRFTQTGNGEPRITRRALADGGTLTEPAVTPAGGVLVGSTSGRLHVLPADGDPWRMETGREMDVRPALAGEDTVVIGNRAGDVAAYDLARRSERWRTRLGGAVRVAPVLDGGTVFLPDSGVAALDLATGKALWRHDRIPAVAVVLGAGRAMYASGATGLTALGEAGWLTGPSAVRLEPAPGRVTVRWRDNDANESGYRVQLCDLGLRCTVAGTAGANATSFVAASLPVLPGEPFFARVQALGRDAGALVAAADALPAGRAVPAPSATGHVPSGPQASGARSSDFVQSAVAAAAEPAPAAPRSLEATARSAGAIRLTWRPSGDLGLLEGFVVERAPTAQGPWADVGFAGPDETLFVDEGLIADTAYSYRLRALSEGGEARSGTAAATTLALRLAAPTGVTAQVGRDGVTVRWQDRERLETGYVVERLAPGSARYEVIGRVGPNAERFVDRVYLAEGVYGYRVKAVNDLAESAYGRAGVRVGTGVPSVLYLPVCVR